MVWPDTRVEDVGSGEFRPPFCPNPCCPCHKDRSPLFAKAGHDRRPDDRSFQRWRCRNCGRTCTRRTFSATYWLKRPELLPHVAESMVSGSANRQAARMFKCAHTTVALQQARLGRHGMLLQLLMLQHIQWIDEAIAYDHFEGFVASQDHAFGMGTPVGERSWFMYGIDDAPHRKGRPGRRRRAVGKEHRRPGAYVRALDGTLARLLSRTAPGQPLELISDAHPGYRSAVARLVASGRVIHRIFPNPPRWLKRSAAARARHRAMFPVDLTHKLLRHTFSHHRRETIAFNRRLNAALERGFVFMTWRNLVKGRSERKADATTPSMLLGLTAKPWDWATVLAQRLFPSRFSLPDRWRQIYRREIVTEIVGRNARHELRYAF